MTNIQTYIVKDCSLIASVSGVCADMVNARKQVKLEVTKKLENAKCP